MQLKAEIALTKDDKSLLESHATLIQQNADAILLKVSSTDFNGVTIASLINQTADTIKIQAEHISLEGIITANGNVKIETDGSITVNNGTFKGSIDTAQDITIGTSANLPVPIPATTTELLNYYGTIGIKFGTSTTKKAYITCADTQTIIGGSEETIRMRIFSSDSLYIMSGGHVQMSGNTALLEGNTVHLKIGGTEYNVYVSGGYLRATAL